MRDAALVAGGTVLLRTVVFCGKAMSCKCTLVCRVVTLRSCCASIDGAPSSAAASAALGDASGETVLPPAVQRLTGTGELIVGRCRCDAWPAERVPLRVKLVMRRMVDATEEGDGAVGPVVGSPDGGKVAVEAEAIVMGELAVEGHVVEEDRVLAGVAERAASEAAEKVAVSSYTAGQCAAV